MVRSSQRGDTPVADAERDDEEMEDWLQATGGPKKGRIVGIPRVPAYTIVPAARSRRRPPTGGSGASGSGAGPSLSDDFFRRIIEGCMASSVVQSGAPSRERIYQLAQEVVHGSIDPTAAADDLMGVVREEAIRVCAVVLANIFPPHIRQVKLIIDVFPYL